MLILFRYHSDHKLTQGVLLFNGKHIADSVEPPWANNARFISCIPDGVYKIEWKETGHSWPCFEVHDVPGRDSILIHPANTAGELEGCIALGTKYGPILWNSKDTLSAVHEQIGTTAELIITSKFGEYGN